MTKEEIIRHASTIDGWFPDYDMESLYYLASRYIPAGGKALEIGSWKGRSSYVIAAVCKDRAAHLTCIDSFEGLVFKEHVKYGLYHGDGGYYKEAEQENFIRFIKENLQGMPVDFLKGDSRDFYSHFPPETFDLVFVDGDHDFPVVGQDTKNFWPMVKKGGVFCGHDYEKGNDVAAAVDSMFTPYEIMLYKTVWSVMKNG